MTLNEQLKQLVAERDSAPSAELQRAAELQIMVRVRHLPPVIPLADVAAAIKVEVDQLNAASAKPDYPPEYYQGAKLYGKALVRVVQRIAATMPEAERATFLQQCGVQP